MASQSGIHRLEPTVRRLDVLVAYDAASNTCDRLVDGMKVSHRMTLASSVQDAGELVRGRKFDVSVVCLDLPPAPHAAARFADFALANGLPVVLVTRSLRWLPTSAAHLRLLAWVSPDVRPEELDAAIEDSLARSATLLGMSEEGERKSFGF